MSTPTFLVTGIDRTCTSAAVTALQFDLPEAVVVEHRIETNTLVRIVSDISGILETERIDLEHACVSCAIREDIIPTLERLTDLDRWGAILAHLPVAAEAVQVCRVCAHSGRESTLTIGGVLLALDGTTLVEDFTSDATLEERGLATFAGDIRGVAESAATLLEYADVVAIVGDSSQAGSDLIDVLRRPTSRRTQDWDGLDSGWLLGGIHIHRDTERWVAEVRRGALPKPQTKHVWTLDLQSDRPLHPGRLQQEMEHLCTGGHRIRGCFWVPTRPADICVMDGAAGQVSLGRSGTWGRKPLTRLTIAGLTGDGDNREILQAAFERCLLTDAEVHGPGTTWTRSSDGLEPWLGAIGPELIDHEGD